MKTKEELVQFAKLHVLGPLVQQYQQRWRPEMTVDTEVTDPVMLRWSAGKLTQALSLPKLQHMLGNAVGKEVLTKSTELWLQAFPEQIFFLGIEGWSVREEGKEEDRPKPGDDDYLMPRERSDRQTALIVTIYIHNKTVMLTQVVSDGQLVGDVEILGDDDGSKLSGRLIPETQQPQA